MSAGNFAVIACHPETGRWHVLNGFASADEFIPLVHLSPWYTTPEHALRYAANQYYEYGYSVGEWPKRWEEPTTCPTCDDYTLIIQRSMSEP